MRSIFNVRTLALSTAALLAFAVGCSREAPVNPGSTLSPATDILPDQLSGPLGSRAYCDGGLQAVAQAAPGVPQPNDLVNNTTVYNTDFVVAGVGGLRDVGSATMALSGVSGSVALAYLYWNGPTDSVDPTANANVMFGGFAISGTNIGFSNDNCWSYDNSQAYRADVTSIVSAGGNGNYALAGFGAGTVNTNGASLVVFFNDGNPSNNRDVVLFEGNDSNQPNVYDADGWNVTLSGINYASGTANIQLHVADGQNFGFGDDAEILLNGLTLEPAGQIFAGNSVPSANNGPQNNGSLWDIRSWDITSFLTPGPNSLTLYSGSVYDCLGLVVALVDLPAGAAPGLDAFFTGGGSIAVGDASATFGFNAGPRYQGGPLEGQLEYNDHGAKKRVHGSTVETLVVNDDCVDFTGACSVNNQSGYTYEVVACDVAEPGTGMDTFAITVWDAGGAVVCQASGTLAGGNVQKHALTNGTAGNVHVPVISDAAGN